MARFHIVTAALALSASDLAQDFVNFEPEERVRAWRTVVDMCDELADEFHEVLEKDQLAARLEPL